MRLTNCHHTAAADVYEVAAITGMTGAYLTHPTLSHHAFTRLDILVGAGCELRISHISVAVYLSFLGSFALSVGKQQAQGWRNIQADMRIIHFVKILV
jgi:hypothetical protein